MRLFRKHIAQVKLHTIDTLTVAGFIRCLYRDDHTAMIVSGKPSEGELKIAWMQLFEKYCGMVENNQYQELSEIYRNILKYSSWIIAAEAFVKVLYFRYNETAIEGLRMLGYDFKFPLDDEQQYLKDLAAVQTRLKAVKIRLKDEGNKLKGITDKSGNTDKTDSEQVFQDNIITLARFVGFPIDVEKVTVSQFAAIQRQYQRYLRRLEIEKENGKQRAHR